ncbi:MAG: CHAT domain-containing protein, partial [Saprospiraceae bacterium]|nr:CHAT domain-containing protein [Saprospiraceae bacterium]
PTLKSLVSDLVSQTRLDEALALAKQQALTGWIEYDTPITMVTAEWDHVKKTALRGMLSFSEESTARQGLIFRLLSIVQNMDKTPVTNDPGSSTNPPKNVLLFLGANPFEHLALALDRELQVVSAGLSQFGKREAFDFRAKMHVTPTDLQRMLLEVQSLQPRFVHFAGNAVVDHPEYGTGVIFEDEDGQPKVISGDLLATIFRQFPSVECVFLNTCDSGPSALAIGKEVKYAIGMNARVFDDVAIEFAVAFYEAIASGNEVPFAFDFAKMRIQFGRAPEQATLPVLIANGQCKAPVYVPGDSHINQPNPRIMR